MVDFSKNISDIVFLLLIAGIPLYGFYRKVSVFDSFVDGAKEGFPLVIKILPYLVAMIMAIGMLRASGAIEFIGAILGGVLEFIGVPKEMLPLAIARPFSGSASNAILIDMIHTYGPDSLYAKMAATVMGSTETTFYVIAVYFGAVGIKKTRYAVPSGLIADIAGLIAAVWICRWLFVLA
ncbi:MAG: spore maturation protein [Pseudomonadota bacterium]|nr:spore maturation protein [Pseudomonadota bacterium]